MKQTGGRPRTKPRFHLLHDPFEIARELLIGMMRRHHRQVLPVIAEVEHQEIEFLQQVLPVRIVGVGGKAVAVREQETDAIRIAVTAHADFGAVVERDVKSHAGSGKLEMHREPADDWDETDERRAASGRCISRPARRAQFSQARLSV